MHLTYSTFAAKQSLRFNEIFAAAPLANATVFPTAATVATAAAVPSAYGHSGGMVLNGLFASLWLPQLPPQWPRITPTTVVASRVLKPAAGVISPFGTKAALFGRKVQAVRAEAAAASKPVGEHASAKRQKTVPAGQQQHQQRAAVIAERQPEEAAMPAKLMAAPHPVVAPARSAVPLPAGWKEAEAPAGRKYYFHTGTKEAKWTRPAAATAAEPPLPAGWKQAEAPDGRTYYYLPGGKETQWVRPTEPVNAAAATPAAAPDEEAGAPSQRGLADEINRVEAGDDIFRDMPPELTELVEAMADRGGDRDGNWEGGEGLYPGYLDNGHEGRHEGHRQGPRVARGYFDGGGGAGGYSQDDMCALGRTYAPP